MTHAWKNEEGVAVDCDFPGGNIIVDRIEGDTIAVRQDLRDTKGDWFYWCFRVRRAANRALTFRFTQGDVIGVLGPAVSTDEGKNWSWLGKEAVDDATFRHAFPADAGEVRFCLAMPYLETNLQEFIGRHGGDSQHLKADVLCRTKKGRDVELLHLGRLDGKSDHRVLITCRHHACEMMASHSLEGLMEAVLAESEQGKWLREHVEFLIVPFMDKDGVENGDQGKNRRPHDHNRDYAGESIYPSVRALRQLAPRWAGGRLRFALDMHCPYIRGEQDEFIYFVGSPNQENWERVKRFSGVLETVQTGPLVFSSENNLSFGQAWNTCGNYHPGKSFSRWAAGLPGIFIGTSIEIPYANASGQAVTAETARAFGRDLAYALHWFWIKMSV